MLTRGLRAIIRGLCLGLSASKREMSLLTLPISSGFTCSSYARRSEAVFTKGLDVRVEVVLRSGIFGGGGSAGRFGGKGGFVWGNGGGGSDGHVTSSDDCLRLHSLDSLIDGCLCGNGGGVGDIDGGGEDAFEGG